MVEDFSEHIGIRLRRAREQAGLSVDDVVFTTRISRGVVTALEAGDFTVFSSSTYAKSFLAQYSSLLNVNARSWLDALEPTTFVSMETVSSILETAGHAKRAEPIHEANSPNGWVSAAVLVVVSCGLIYLGLRGYYHLDDRFSDAVLSAEPAQEEVQAEPEAASPSLPPLAVQQQADVNESPLPKLEAVFSEPPPRAIIVR